MYGLYRVVVFCFVRCLISFKVSNMPAGKFDRSKKLAYFILKNFWYLLVQNIAMNENTVRNKSMPLRKKLELNIKTT